MAILDIMMEGTVSQMCYSGPSSDSMCYSKGFLFKFLKILPNF